MGFFSLFFLLFFTLLSFLLFQKADSNNSWRDRWRITRGSWSCIERRAQTEAVALIKNTAPISAKPWERKEGGGKDGEEKERQTEGRKEREEEIGESQRSKKKKKKQKGEKSLAPPLDTASAGLL